jgi:hypothetical protein
MSCGSVGVGRPQVQLKRLAGTERLGVGSPRIEIYPGATQPGEHALHRANAMPADTVGIERAVRYRTHSLREAHYGHHLDA